MQQAAGPSHAPTGEGGLLQALFAKGSAHGAWPSRRGGCRRRQRGRRRKRPCGGSGKTHGKGPPYGKRQERKKARHGIGLPCRAFDVVLTDLRWPGGVRPSAPPCFEKMPGLPKAGKAPGRLWKTALPQGLGFEKGGNAAKEGGYTGRGRRLRKRPPPGGRGRRPACRRRAQSFFSASAAISFMCFGMSMCWGHLDRQVPQATQLSARWPASRA